MQTRRAALVTIAGAAASPIFLPQGASAQSAAPAYFKPADYALVSRLADLILPKTDTPGALDAHVPFRIDHEVAVSSELQKKFEAGLALLRAKDFMSLTEAQQIGILHAMSQAGPSPDNEFFQTIKGMTVDWYYRSEEGLVGELGYHGNTFRAEFPGCTHPEHWPEIG